MNSFIVCIGLQHLSLPGNPCGEDLGKAKKFLPRDRLKGHEGPRDNSAD